MIGPQKILALLVLSAGCMVGAEDRDWQTGKVLDSLSVHAYLVGTEREGTLDIRSTQLLILGTEFTFVVDRSSLRTWRGKPGLILGSAVASMTHRSCRFIIGDPIKYSQVKGQLYVLDPDGRQCKLEIVRQERLQH